MKNGHAGGTRKKGYLLLERYPGEKIMIETTDGLITLMVTETRRRPLGHDKVCVGIKAPKTCPIMREELYVEGPQTEEADMAGIDVHVEANLISVEKTTVEPGDLIIEHQGGRFVLETTIGSKTRRAKTREWIAAEHGLTSTGFGS